MPPLPASHQPSARPPQNLRTILALMLREMSSTYGRSPGGYVWAVLEPIMIVAVVAVAFSFVFHRPSLGTSFFLFYATALMPLRMFQEVQTVTSSAVRYSKALLVYPVVSFADALLARLALAVLTQLVVSAMVLGGALFWLDTRLVLEPGPILLGFALAALLGFGIGAVNCLLFELFPIWKSLFTAAMRPLILVSAVLYVFEDLPRGAQQLIWWNPLVHISGVSRTGYYSYYSPDYISLLFVSGLGLGALAFGLLLLRKHYRKILVI